MIPQLLRFKVSNLKLFDVPEQLSLCHKHKEMGKHLIPRNEREQNQSNKAGGKIVFGTFSYINQ
jgi:hypothetical protein